MLPIVCKEENEAIINPALILIPDITGFTNFIKTANLKHSQIRIASLLVSILDSNILNLEVSEIEGDAILFYKFNDSSTFEEIINQCKLMFSKFHEQLDGFKKIGCQCDSCELLQSLTLKFIIHYGNLGSVMVRKYCKLYGKDLIIAHRLLKNSLPLGEYILVTENVINQYGFNADRNKNQHWKKSFQDISEMGIVNFHFMALS
tara:strand:+ start:980 stop:1591 length:612 start_codon:yes stop_codon:yes gene_type:complete